jgi:serine/alanine adding enzyme
MRSLQDLPFVPESSRGWYDTISPEYTGPWAEGFSTLPGVFQAQFALLCRQEKLVAEFAHLHPWNWCTACAEPSAVSFDREIVYLDLTLSEDQLWHESYTYACRKNIARTQKENVRVFTASTAEHVREFYRIYTHTMDRNNALEHYYFPLDYFQAFFEQMPQHARFVLAEWRDQIVAATLYLHDDVDVYSYLGGADQTFQQIRPTNAVVYDTIRWAQQQGKRRLILGGGYKPDDGIFRFKASFSPLRARFHVYRQIHLPDEYHALCIAWEKYHGMPIPETGYFPAYRSIPRSINEVVQS